MNRPRSRKRLTELMTEISLVDIWREIYPDKPKYAWHKFNTIKQGHLYYFFFFISDELLSVINGAKIESSYHSEYCLISIELKSGHTHRRKTFCKFNNSLLVM